VEIQRVVISRRQYKRPEAFQYGAPSTANATEKRCEDDKSITNYDKQLTRVLSGAVNQK
jgi:hypothetical protein